jgi:hypothetical protein
LAIARLKLVPPEQIQAAAALQDMDIEIQIVKNKKQIVIPSDKAAARELLDFLCQARFIGPLTQELFIANSYRPVGKKVAAIQIRQTSCALAMPSAIASSSFSTSPACHRWSTKK